VIGEAVWWVTIVDATLVRHHLDVYDGALAARPPAERRLIEGTLGGPVPPGPLSAGAVRGVTRIPARRVASLG
jgi:hypothetical protein